MITVPSVEFVGLLGDVLSFALDDPDFPDLNCIRIAWDGELLHTCSGERVGHASGVASDLRLNRTT